MIHDATGKFSSRWVFPDRSSLALVIKKLATFVRLGAMHRRLAHALISRPHIGEYAAKTNAIWADRPYQPRLQSGRNWPDATVNGFRRGLLAVVLEHHIAGRGDLGTILLQASQDREIALVDHRAAETLHVAGTGLLLVRGAAALLLRKGVRRNRDRQQGECQEKFTHRIPSFRQQEILFPNCVSASPGGFCGMAGAA